MLALKMEESREKESSGQKEYRAAPLKASNGMGTLKNSQKELNSVNKPRESGSRFSSEPPVKS